MGNVVRGVPVEAVLIEGRCWCINAGVVLGSRERVRRGKVQAASKASAQCSNESCVVGMRGVIRIVDRAEALVQIGTISRALIRTVYLQNAGCGADEIAGKRVYVVA